MGDMVGTFQEIKVTLLSPNPENPRKRFDEADLEELAASIKEHGVVEPLVVVKGELYGYVIICGERRWRAAQLAEVKTVPCIVRELTPAAAAEIMLIENVQRRDLDPIEEAKAFQALLTQHGYTQETLAEKIGVSQAQVANRLRLLRLPEDVQNGISRKIVPAAGALELLKLEQSPLMAGVVKEVLSGNVTVKDMASKVTYSMRENGRSLDPGEWNGPKFDLAGCQGCRNSAKVPRWSGEGSVLLRCLDPACWDKKQNDHLEAEQKARLAALKEKADKVLDVSKMKHGDYVSFSYASEWKGIDRSACDGCDKKLPAKDYDGRIIDVCTDPSCQHKKAHAATRAAKAAEREETENELVNIAARAQATAARLILRGPAGDQVVLDRKTLIYLAAVVMRDVHSAYERPTLFRYVQRTFGWEDECWKSGWDFKGGRGTVEQRLNSLRDDQLLRIVFEWPAVAHGPHDNLMAYALGLPIKEFLHLVRDRHCEPCGRTTVQELMAIDGQKQWQCRSCRGLSSADESEDDRNGEAEADEFSDFMCPDCGSEMSRRDDGMLACVNSDCGALLSEDEAREIIAEDAEEEA